MKKTTDTEQMKTAMAQVKSLIAQLANAAAQDIAALTAADVDAVPITRKVNGKALSADISLSAADVGAAAAGHTHTAAQVGAAAANHTHTAAQVGAAASGHTHTAAQVGAQARAVHGSLTIPVSGWSSDSTATYSKYYDIAVSGVTANDRASVDLAPASAATAVKCGLCPACETLAGKIRIRAVSVPAASMTANYWIEKGS